MSTAASPNYLAAANHVAYASSSTPPAASGLHNSSSRAAATRLDDAINQLRSVKQNGGGKSYQTHVSSPLKGPVLSPRSITAAHNGPASPGGTHYVTHQFTGNRGTQAISGAQTTNYKTVHSSTAAANGNMIKTGVTASRKPAIPEQLRKQTGPSSPLSKVSPSGSTRSSSASSYGDAHSHRPHHSTVVFDAQGRCTCCPFGYHVDIDFVNFSQDVHSPTATFNKPVRKSRLSFDSQSSHGSQHGSQHGTTNYSSLFIDDVEGSVKPVTAEVTHRQQSVPRSFSSVERSSVSPATTTVTTSEDVYRSYPNGQLVKSGSSDTVDSMMSYTNQVKTTRRTVTSTQLAETMATHLPDNGGAELTISPESVEQIKKHMALSLQRMQELEDQVKMIPMMQERISRLKSDKKMLAEQLANKSGVSCMRSIGVGDYDVHTEHTRIEKVIQTVVQEASPKPSASIAVGNYDVNVEYMTEAEAYHTIAEKVQRIKEKEIQTWIEEGEKALASRRAAMRSCGVGDGDVFAEPETIKVKETEIKTVYIEPDKPEQRNVGLQVKPSMRDVCIEFSHQEEKPLTRTCGVNVDINDIIQEMQSQSEEMDRVDYGQLQSGALTAGQKNMWQVQKHVIQRKFMEAMHRGTQNDLVAFITGLLRRSVKSVGTTVKPDTADFGMKTSSSGIRGTDVGVGEDTVDVTVKPFVMTRDNFCTVRPSTRTQPTWTDLILTCDSATNTQQRTTDRAVNTVTAAPQQQLVTVSSTLVLRPACQYTIVKELYTGQQQSTLNHVPKTSKAKESMLLQSPRVSPTSKMSTTTKSVRTSSSSSGGGGAESSVIRRSSGSGGGGFSLGEISREYVDEVLSAPSSRSARAKSTSDTKVNNETLPDHLVEQKTEISEDGAVSEITREVKAAPGMREEKTVRVTKQQSPDGRVSESTQSDSTSQQTKSISTRSTLTSDEESVLGSSFHKHKEEMMKLLSEQKDSSPSPISVEVVPAGGRSSTVTTSHTFTSQSAGSPTRTISPQGTIIEREGAAQRKYEEDLRRKNSSLSTTYNSPTSTGTSTKRLVSSGSDDRGDYSEVIEEKESEDGLRKEVVIEKTFTSSGGSGRFESNFPSFSDYFSRGKEGPPTGRAERMQRYDNSSYSTTSTAEVERNKTEMSGDPLKARYNINDLSAHDSMGGNSSTWSSTVTRSVRSFSSERNDSGGEDGSLKSPRSIMKKDSTPTGNRNISFAEQAEVAEVISDDEGEPRDEKDADMYSDEEESEVSFEEGTYDGRKGDVSYLCDIDQTASTNLSKAKSQEEIDVDVELQAACSIVQQHIESGDSTPNSKMSSALSVIQQDWFKVASGQKANLREVDGYMACFEDFSVELLEHIINMTDGNGNTALHYAVSHCNFPIVKLIVESGVADVNLQNKAGYTPIMLAALAEVQTDDDRAAIQQLLSRGNVNLAASQAGQTALMLAVSHGRLEMVDLLLEAGADINMKDEDGSTALMCATEHGHIDIVKTLLAHADIDISLKDTDGSTALEIALENSQKEIGILLYAKDQANKANSTTSIKKRTSRIPASHSQSRGGNKSSRVVTVTRRRY